METVFRILNPSSRGMDDSCELVELPAVTLAVVAAELSQQEIPARITDLFDRVHCWLTDAPVTLTGNRYAVYDRFAEGSMRLRAGVPVSGVFEATGDIDCVELPGLKAAHYRHHGAYGLLPAAHMTLNEWCMGNAVERLPLSIEIYGDWQEDESRLQTDIFIQVV